MDFHMFSPLLATLGIDLILMTVIMAAASAAQAAAAQAAARKAADAQNAQMKDAQAKSMAVNKAQGDISAAEKRRAIQNRYDAYKGATKASSAERGLDSGSRTTTALMNALGIGAARESGASAARHHRHPMLMCCLHYLGDLLGRAGEDDGEGLAYFGARRAILLIGRKPIGLAAPSCFSHS